MENSNKTIWNIDPTHSEVGFKVKHMMISTVTGYFDEFHSTIKADGDDFQNATVEFTAKIASISTKNNDRDTHLKSDDFFNAEKFPELKFVSRSFTDGKLTGDLTIRDITKEVVLDIEFNGIVKDPYGQTKAGFQITGEINRKDYQLRYNNLTEAGSMVVSEKVKIIVDAQFIKQA